MTALILKKKSINAKKINKKLFNTLKILNNKNHSMKEFLKNLINY